MSSKAWWPTENQRQVNKLLITWASEIQGRLGMNDNWQPTFSQDAIEILDDKTLYSGHFDVLQRRLKFKLFAGGWSDVIQRNVVVRQHAAAVLLYNPQRETVVMVEQMRVGAIDSSESPWLLEPVAGLIELDDTPEETAIRESVEEAGCEVLELIPMLPYLVSSGICTELCYTFCGRIKESQSGSLHGLEEESEDIKVHEIPVNEAFSLLAEGKIIAVSAVVSLQWLQLNLDNLNKKWGG